MKLTKKINPQSGNVLFYILIAVVLFGALSFAVSGMIRGSSGGSVSKEKAIIYAAEISAYAQQIHDAIKNMQILNDCADEDISFENAILSGYAHSPVATDECQVFDDDGGGLTYEVPLPEYGDGSDWVFNGGNDVDLVGTSDPDLIAMLPNIDLDICNAINKKSGITALGSDAAIDFTKFVDTYASTETIDAAAGYNFGCLNYVNSGNNYFFYYVLKAR